MFPLLVVTGRGCNFSYVFFVPGVWYTKGMDKGELYRVALSYLGAKEFVPGSAEVSALDAVLPQVLRVAAGYARWRWALRRAVVQLHDGAAELPGDYVEMERCGLRRWDVIGSELVALDGTQDGNVELVFVSRSWADEQVLPERAPLFCEALALLLAAKAAPRVMGSHELAAGLQARAERMLYRARLAEVRSMHSNDQVEAEEEEEGF